MKQSSFESLGAAVGAHANESLSYDTRLEETNFSRVWNSGHSTEKNRIRKMRKEWLWNKKNKEK